MGELRVTASNRTDIVVDYIKDLQYSDLPSEVITKAKQCVLDSIGVALAGTTIKVATIAKEFALEHFGSGASTILGHYQKSTCIGAAWANCIAASALDLDDGHTFSAGHPGCVIIPSALALAELKGASGKEFLLAIVAAYEVAVRVAGSRVPAYVHTCATGPWGTYGAAIAAAKLLRLDKNKIVHSIGIAGSHSPARPHSKNYQFVPMVKECIGWAGMTGLSAALLAQKGFTAFTDFLDYEEFFDGDALTGTLKDKYEILDTWFKPHSSCRWTHPSIDAILQLKDEYALKPEDIRKIEVRTFERASIMGQKLPISVESAQYSIPYCLASALYDGQVGPDQFKEEQIGDPKLLDLASRVEIVYDDEMHEYFPEKFTANVVVHTDRGVFNTKILSPKGDMDNPLSAAELEAKFDRLAGLILDEGRVQELKSYLMRLESVDNVNEFTQLMSST